VEPDVMTLAKGMGGGVSVGAFMAKEEFSVLEYGDHGSTYGGNSLLCAVAAAVFNYVVDNDLPSHVAQVGEYLKSKLTGLRTKYPFITDVRGRGLLLAVEFEQEIAADLLTAALERGFIMNSPLPNAVRLMPPLVLTEAEADEAVALLDASIEAVVA
jgi:acetylornithine/N-succinyldiaminopimelate aminotransferase